MELIHFENVINYWENCDAVAVKCMQSAKGDEKATQCPRRHIKSICSRPKAKEGWIREHLLGKSVDFSARTLITPDPNINMMNWEYHGVFDLDLKYLETVTPYNIELSLNVTTLLNWCPDLFSSREKVGAIWLPVRAALPWKVLR
ncbi:hypothetical protein BDA96_04G348700 [Sorghum bicolor]|uniref:DNA-directed RNA polymerase n=1 Tax=Sorghum bicolor TaxID=4558 RepID=A0A921R8D8_SORBI|nr:hypothetical protein BDA96_04G348700 [Sorghum bicolor]